MFLKRLEIQGFKSFPDKINMDFSSGITSIVGPNGSGKSNISDAISWVLGEQSVKNLRGSKMEDVIFSGTQVRNPVSFAEVSIIIDNSDKALAKTFDEVTITRRVYRSGEGEYFINKANCRLRDIYELFMDTGIGRDGYSIIGQGKIDHILSSKSEDRRQIFEEAAGISKFRYKREEAEKKLKQTDENLIRINDIISEIELQVGPLKIQQQKAKKYLKLKEELEGLEISIYIHQIDKLKKELEGSEQSFKASENELLDIKNQIKEMEIKTEKLYESIKNNDSTASDIRLEIEALNSSLTNHNYEIGIFENTITHSKENIERIENELSELSDKDLDFFERLNDLNSKYDVLYEMKAKEETEIEALNNSFQSIASACLLENSVIEELKTEIIEKMNKVSELKIKLNTITTMKSNFESRQTTISKEISEKESILLTAREKDKEIEKNLKNSLNDLEIFTNKKAQNDEIIYKTRQNLNNKQSDYQNDLNSYNQKSSKLKVLKELENEYEGYNRAVKNVMEAYKGGSLSSCKIYGPISSLIEVAKKYSLAIEVALSASMQSIVTQSEEDAKKAISYLKKERLGRATFLPLSTVSGSLLSEPNLSKEKGFIDLACNLVKIDDKFKSIALSTLGRIAVVDNIDNAVIIAKKYSYKFRIVTLDGEILAPGGSISGGSFNKTVGILTRKSEIDQLLTETKGLNQSIKSLNDEITSLQNEMNKLNEINISLEAEIKKHSDIKIKADADITHSKILIESIVSNIFSIKNEQNEIENSKNTLENDILTTNNNILNLEKQIKEYETKISERQEGFSSVVSQREQINNQIVSKKMLQSSLLKDIEIIENQKNELLNSKSIMQDKIEKMKAEKLLLEEKIEDMQSDIEFKKQQIEGINETIKEKNLLIDETLKNKANSSEKITQKQSKLKELMDLLFNKQEEYSKIENKKTRIDAELEALYNRLWDEYELTYSTANSVKKEIDDISYSQKRIVRLKDEIKSLGNINLDSIEEYQKVSERFEFLTNQKNDLDNAKNSLEKVIIDMTSVMKTKFKENFNKINKKFSEIFIELFGGGSGELSLLDPENVLESPIEIKVSPPGKKLSNISLLSGGEKAFTAIAILFAILSVKPTPFCILDEIEAALDEVNVYKFANYLKRFVENTQFIIVTHRRGTMEAANILYGVTMEEQGVSKLLPLSLDEMAV